MKTSRLLALLLITFSTFSLSAQIDFKIQLMPDGTKWGIYASMEPGTSPTPNTITATGQITMVAPLGFTIVDFNPVSGFWANNAVINGPTENPTKSYISFGLMTDDPKIIYSSTAPTLLFTFRKAANFCPDEMYLIENGVDPFDQLPNSANSNPGNEITVLDLGYTPPSIYNYGENIAPFAWDCHDCDGDGIPNALEDTNGNGVYDPNIDVSDLCGNGGGGGGCVEITGAELHCENGGTNCGDNPAGGQISLVVDIAGGEAPFTIKYTDGSNVYDLQDYQSGTPFSVDATNGAIYSIVSVTGDDGCEADANDLTGEVPVTFPSALQFTTQPVGSIICNGEATMFTACATASNASFSFSWQYSADNGATWQPVPLGTVYDQTNTGTISSGCDELLIGATIGLQGYRFRAVASGSGVPTAYSQAAILQLEGPIQISAQPQNIAVCDGEPAIFTATVTNAGAGTASYQWQTSNDGGQNWSGISDNTIYSGSSTNSLNVANTSGMLNQQFRLKAQVGSCNAVYSQPAQLSVEGPFQILAVMSPGDVCRGSDACFEVQAMLLGNGQLFYQWQERATGSSTWTDIQGASAPIFCLSNTEGHNGYCYRALVRTASCPAITSVEACLVVQDKAVFYDQPQDLTVCAGSNATLSAAAAIDNGYTGFLTYLWQHSDDGGQTWQNVVNDNNILGAPDGTLFFNDVTPYANQRFRLSASTGICETTYSDAATITVEDPVEFIIQPLPSTVCPGTEASFFAAPGGFLDYQVQWQTSQNGTNWTDLTDGNSYSGTQAHLLTVHNATANRLFRLKVVVGTGACGAKYSDPASLTVEAPIVFSQQPENVLVCPDETASFEVAVSGGSGPLSLQWQSSLDGQTWTDLVEDAIFSGTQTSNLNVAEVAGLDGTMFRLVAASENCSAISVWGMLTLEEDAVCNPTPTYRDCVTLTVKRLDGNIGWSVWAKADSSFTETPYQLPTGGRVTVVIPTGFAIQGLASYGGGKWKPGKVFFNPPQDPGKIYFEFNLTPNQNFLELTPGVEKLLFEFSVVGGCPTYLSLMDDIVPAGFSPNEFSGFGAGDGPDVPFHACGIYGPSDWDCPTTWNLMAPTGGNTIANSQSIEIGTNSSGVISEKAKNLEAETTSYFGVAPNPVRDELRVAFDENIMDKTALLRLMNLQGQVISQIAIEGEAIHRLDMSNTIPGIYFLCLEVDGKLVQREKIIVQ
ncbi:MAG: T9SS type A sorting domain-containing protein [Bacteroidetes bacterium]|nr:T9SS type A sorting domain-containing protein [Bacteroidota bacterium]